MCYQLYWLSSPVYEAIKLVQCVIKVCVQQREELYLLIFHQVFERGVVSFW